MTLIRKEDVLDMIDAAVDQLEIGIRDFSDENSPIWRGYHRGGSLTLRELRRKLDYLDGEDDDKSERAGRMIAGLKQEIERITRNTLGYLTQYHVRPTNLEAEQAAEILAKWMRYGRWDSYHVLGKGLNIKQSAANIAVDQIMYEARIQMYYAAGLHMSAEALHGAKEFTSQFTGYTRSYDQWKAQTTDDLFHSMAVYGQDWSEEHQHWYGRWEK